MSFSPLRTSFMTQIYLGLKRMFKPHNIIDNEESANTAHSTTNGTSEATQQHFEDKEEQKLYQPSEIAGTPQNTKAKVYNLSD